MQKLAILVVIWLLPLVVGQMSVNTVSGGSAFAADAPAKKAKKKKTRRVATMGERTYKKLAEAQAMIDPESMPREEGEPPPEPTGTPQDAIELLMKLAETRLNSNELAQIWNTLAFAYYTLGDIPNTIRSYERILQQGAIPEALELSSLRALFQLYYSEDDYRKSIEFMDRWEVANGAPDPQITFIRATAYYQLEELLTALKYAIDVEEIANAQNRTMKENWWYLQVVLYNEQEDVDNVIRVLETLILNYPKKRYWMHLAGMYSEKNQDDKSLSAYYAAYIQGFFQKEAEVVMLAQRLLGASNPHEASQVLVKGMQEELVEENLKNLRLLATAYTLAQETNLAIEAWRDATEYAEDGKLHYRLAQALAAEDRHKEAVQAYSDAQKKGELEKPADVAFWKGISHMQLNQWGAATRALRDAEKLDKKKSRQVRQYVKYIASEKRRLEEIRRMLTGVS